MTTALDIFRALADASRLRIMALLQTMELSVGELAQVLGQSQPRVSRHVKILCDAGLAERRKEGSWVFLALGDAALVGPVIAAFDAWGARESDHWAVADAARLAAVRADRAAAANADDLRLIKSCTDLAVECALRREAGVIGHDEDQNNVLRAIEFPRIKGGKPFNIDTPWFVETLKSIGQPKGKKVDVSH